MKAIARISNKAYMFSLSHTCESLFFLCVHFLVLVAVIHLRLEIHESTNGLPLTTVSSSAGRARVGYCAYLTFGSTENEPVKPSSSTRTRYSLT